MRTFIRAALASVIALAFFVGPVSAATTQAIQVAQAGQTGTVTGQVTGDSGQSISGAVAGQMTVDQALAGFRQIP